MDAMSIDMNTSGNSDIALGMRQTCARINENGVQDADETGVDSVTFDTTAEGVPPWHDNGTPLEVDDDSGGIISYSFDLQYPPGVVVIGHQVELAGISMMKRDVASAIFDFSDTTPDGDSIFEVAVLDTGSGPPESGAGVLSRILIESSAAIASGIHPLTFTNNVHNSADGLSYFPDVTNNGLVAINVPCSGDSDGDGIPDNEDTDDDNDGVADIAETPCGADPIDVIPPLSRPERIDGAFAAVDDDGDTLVDEALPAGASAFDCDGDGYRGSAEAHIATYLPGPPTDGDQKTCQEYDTAFPNTAPHVKPSKRWPADLAGVTTFSLNKINVQDISSFVSPIRYMNQDVGTDPGDVRFDLVPGTTFGFDINIADLAAITSGASGFPPMLGGARAFNGPVCPYAP
jgi:hypothetical protein